MSRDMKTPKYKPKTKVQPNLLSDRQRAAQEGRKKRAKALKNSGKVSK